MYFILRLTLVALLVLSVQFTSALMQNEEQTQSEAPQTMPTISYEIIQTGTYSGIKEPLQKVITSKQGWEEVWKKHVSVLVPQPPLPEVDFDEVSVGAIYAGEKKTSGYKVELKSVTSEGKNAVIRYSMVEPPGNSFTLQVLTQPFVLVKVAKPEGTVQFVKE